MVIWLKECVWRVLCVEGLILNRLEDSNILGLL